MQITVRRREGSAVILVVLAATVFRAMLQLCRSLCAAASRRLGNNQLTARLLRRFGQ